METLLFGINHLHGDFMPLRCPAPLRQKGGRFTPKYAARYYISSLPPDAQRILQATRTHWGIENPVQWVLDMVFREDESRIRKDHGPKNFALLRQIAPNLLKQEHTIKHGVKAKRLTAG